MPPISPAALDRRTGVSYQDPNPQGDLDALIASLFDGGGSPSSMMSSISDSYDGQIAAYNDLLGTLGASGEQLVGSIRSAADATSGQIGSFFGYAADQANAGRPVIAETGDKAQANVDSIYNDLAGSLAGQSQAATDRAAGAAGGAVASGVGGRVESAIAPFAAAGETSRANAKANLTQHSAAGQNYLSQIAGAAPSEAAMQQSAVASQANAAVSEAEMAMAQQRAEIAAQTAALEGAKQRAIIEHSADMAGSTFDRIMGTAKLFDAVGADKSGLREGLGLSADPTGGMSYEDQLDVMWKEQRLADAQAPEPGPDAFMEALPTATAQGLGSEILNIIDTQGLDQAGAMNLVNQLTNVDPYTGENTPDGVWGNLGRRTGQNAPIMRDGYVESLEELLADPNSSMWTAVDPEILRGAVRKLFS